MEEGWSLETERLLLRPFTLDDAAFLQELLNEPDWYKFIGDRGIHSIEDAERYVESGPLSSYKKHGFGPFAVTLKQTEEEAQKEGGGPEIVLGMCGLLQRDHLDFPDLGFAFRSAHYGKGYATEAARAVVQWAFVKGYDKVYGIVSEGHQASIAVLERCGLKHLRRVPVVA